MDDRTVGRRLRRIRLWRDLTQREAAELAGFTGGYLSLIERGVRPIDRRSTLEALANALRVAPSELTGGTYLAPGAQQEHAVLVPLRLVLGVRLSDPVDVEPPAWPMLRERVVAMNALAQDCDFVSLGAALCELIPALHACSAGPHRREALVGLLDCYCAAQALTKHLGAGDLSQIAARHVQDVSDALSGPQWFGLAAWSRAQAIGSTARDQALLVVTRAAVEVSSALDDPAVAEVYGSLHLVAALSVTTLGRVDDAAAHVAEAVQTAGRPGVGTGFGHLWFGRGNVDIWRTMLAVEAGEGGRAVEIARGVDPTTLPASAERKSSFYVEVGRGMAMERSTRDEAVRAFRTAEEIAPQRVRTNPFVREIVTDLRQRSQPDDVGRELRGLAYRMGISI